MLTIPKCYYMIFSVSLFTIYAQQFHERWQWRGYHGLGEEDITTLERVSLPWRGYHDLVKGITLQRVL